MYTYEQIKEYLETEIIENVVCVFKSGSELFCSNCNDYDYTIITKKSFGLVCKKIIELKTDLFIMSINELNEKLKNDNWRYKLCVCMAKADNSNIIYGKLPTIDTDILSKEYLLKTMLIEYNFGKRTYFNNRPNKKPMVWGLALYYFITNNSFVLTETQKENLQKCHDGLIDNDFIIKFYNDIEYLLFNNLKEEYGNN